MKLVSKLASVWNKTALVRWALYSTQETYAATLADLYSLAGGSSGCRASVYWPLIELKYLAMHVPVRWTDKMALDHT
jgi:hypothetical protein